MDSKAHAVKTELGILKGRDAIHVDKIEQVFNKLIIRGEVNSNSCEQKFNQFKWYAVEISFIGIKFYKCEHIDIYDWKVWNTVSCFDEVRDSTLNEKYKLSGKKYRHYILETYDYVYFVLCEEVELKVIGRR